MVMAEYQDYEKWYHSKRWERKAKHQLWTQPLCAMCLKSNTMTAARVADHVVPHRGDVVSFWIGKLQSLCTHCHNKTKRNLEVKGYTDEIGTDGWPTHPNHPANRAK